MKFSDLVKQQEKEVSKTAKEKTDAKQKPAAPSQKETVKPPPRKREESAPPEDLKSLVRDQLADEVRSQLEKIQRDLQKDSEQKLQEMQERLQARDEELKEQRENMNRLLRRLDESTPPKPAEPSQEDVREEVMRRIAEERSQWEEAAKKKSDASQERIKKLEEELKKKDQAPAPPPEIPPPKQVEPPAVQKAPPPPPPPPPKKEPVPSTPVHETASSPVAAESVFFDPSAQVKAKKMYDQLMILGNTFFEQIIKTEPTTIDGITVILKEVVELAPTKNAELISIFLKPYTEAYSHPSYFTHHALNVAFLSVVIGIDFKYSPEQLLELAQAAFFHDVGLVNVREDLNYPKQLGEETKQEVMMHPERGVKMMTPYVDEPCLIAIREHHEVGNGKGYPQGLSADQIHPYAKIIHVVDSFDALTHQRPYRKQPLDVSEAMKEVIELGRGLYDSLALKSLMGRVGLYPVMSLVELNSKQVARVMSQNPQFPLSPTVRIEFDEKGRHVAKPTLLDLSQSRFNYIVGPAQEKETAKSKLPMQRLPPPRKA